MSYRNFIRDAAIPLNYRAAKGEPVSYQNGPTNTYQSGVSAHQEIAELRRQLAEAQQARDTAIQNMIAWDAAVAKCCGLEKDQLRGERDTYARLLLDIWNDPASGALQDGVFHRLEQITVHLTPAPAGKQETQG